MAQELKNERQKKLRTITHPWRVFGFEAVLFSLGLALGILSAKRLTELFEVYRISPPQASIWQFVIWFIFLTIFIVAAIFLLKFKKGRGLFFKGLFLLAVVLGNLFFFSLWLPDIFSLLLVFILTLVWWKRRSAFSHNMFLIFAIAGIGARIGLSLTPESVIILLFLFSIYDYIAVYKTKHMVKMARAMIEEKAIMGVVIPQKLSGFKADLNLVKPGGEFLVLGTGDIVFPLMLAASLVPQGIVSALIVMGMSLLGLLTGFLTFVSQRIRRPMPALPTIALFSIIGYLITRII